MPETYDKNPCPTSHSNSRNNNNNSQLTITNRVLLCGQRQATDFTTTQELKLRAGDVRMARMQISLTKLRNAMDQSNKLIEQLCQEIQMEMNSSKK
ncbi:uncharacterized protein LOC117782082 [Drosophila innubila]|uniref:uncharacterized protein LOC117782082 n=1 Tax=Drosophila innubila TaxID=198719 RepID=UPI00148CEF9B|nr:uncharacterized protein LOC117782082 [Drosophila innubila]